MSDRKFADEEHLRRHVRHEVKALSVQLYAALGALEGGDLEAAVDRFDGIETSASELSRVCLDWPDNQAKPGPDKGTEEEER